MPDPNATPLPIGFVLQEYRIERVLAGVPVSSIPSVTSRMILDAPTIAPALSRIGDTDSETWS